MKKILAMLAIIAISPACLAAGKGSGLDSDGCKALKSACIKAGYAAGAKKRLYADCMAPAAAGKAPKGIDAEAAAACKKASGK